MKEVIEVVNRLNELGSNASLSSLDKTEIENLYTLVLNKKFVRTSCSNCYHDAVIEMIVYLKKNKKMKEKSEYGLKNGALLQMEFGSSEFYTNENLTDEIAEKYLSKYPGNIGLFAKKPDDWEDRIANRGKAYDSQLLESVRLALVDGVSVDSILEEFASYKINGRKVTKKLLNEYIKEASSIIETEEKDMTSDNNIDETGEKVKVEE
ncbi:hypothetical protein [Phocaeicola coprocola]|jgi:hypothetical protein|uniref:hypothetical protein n=1 Tax=Phocaeicola coprocola TaxID=310298 RepID=UPI001C37EDCC|nr:hypothetical protein [Phocaeicola coprocola]MBV3867536.1 hypothetical protein [Phocaeicola coprocola]MBV4008622.1 hypothetical protein [Phocaeicola coprocola]MBV4033145.1 hypothetical protein [Phocaeicola coprocola]MBV4039701.1 hypothetical protein [Phocaeicola coprocola]MBV4061362.1 hypothetical protein [Phocaeicola coprocola]